MVEEGRTLSARDARGSGGGRPMPLLGGGRPRAERPGHEVAGGEKRGAGGKLRGLAVPPAAARSLLGLRLHYPDPRQEDHQHPREMDLERGGREN